MNLLEYGKGVMTAAAAAATSLVAVFVVKDDKGKRVG